MNIAILRESASDEQRVALDPDRVRRLVKSGHTVTVVAGAGSASFFLDDAYAEAGAQIVADAETALQSASAVLKINPPSDEELAMLGEGTLLIAFLYPLSNPALTQQLLKRNITSFSMDLVPRIARAQKMDALSSMSSIAGYKAVLLAANELGKYFPMLITAAGTIAPAKVLVLGAGVAGLQAIATARRLGAVVSAYDIRPAVKEQVESLGGAFLEVDLGEDTEDEGGYAKALSEDAQRKGQEMIHEHLMGIDVVITTALIPGKPAPKLVTEAMVRDMKPGSVIVDLAAETGGNCELTQAGETSIQHDVVVCGPLNVPASMPDHASQLYARNIVALFEHLMHETELQLDFEDEITQESCLTHGGEIINPRVKEALAVKSA